jgi:cytoskeletal protein CcmA (bactofilin family)
VWHSKDESKSSSPARDLVVTPAPEYPRSAVSPAIEPGATTGNVSRSLTIKGEITGKEDLFIDGEVQGGIRIPEGIVTVGPNGQVTADIESREIVIRGKVKGTLRGHERVQILRTGQASGEILTPRVAIEDGALFRGKIEITRGEEIRGSRSTQKAPVRETPRPMPVGATEPSK